MKKLLLILMICLLMTGCTLISYKTKGNINPDYYEDYLEELGYVDVVLVQDLISKDMLNMTYELFDIDTNTKSEFIYYYNCFDEFGSKYHAFMPDKVGEEDIVFKDFLLSNDELVEITNTYNEDTNGVIFELEGSEINTLDIIIKEDELAYKFVEDLYTPRKINGVSIDVDTESIKSLISENLSLPIIYNIGRYYIYGYSPALRVYLGKGFEGEYVFLLEDYVKGTVEIIYNYSKEA